MLVFDGRRAADDARLLRLYETYLVWQRICSKILQRKLEFSNLVTASEEKLDGDRRVWRRCLGVRSHDRWLGTMTNDGVEPGGAVNVKLLRNSKLMSGEAY